MSKRRLARRRREGYLHISDDVVSDIFVIIGVLMCGVIALLPMLPLMLR